MFEHRLKCGQEITPGTLCDSSLRDGFFTEDVHLGQGRSFGHVGQYKGDPLGISVVQLLIDGEIELDGVH